MDSKDKNRKNASGPTDYHLSKKGALALLLSIFIGEMLIMAIVRSMSMQSVWVETLVDSLLLSIIILPAVLYFVSRPLNVQIARRKQAQEELNEALAMAEATLDSIHNGILVVSNHGTILKTNPRFAEMWHIPAEILASGDNMQLWNNVIGQLTDPEWLLTSGKELHDNPEAESSDLIYFKDGRIYERISKPFYSEGKPNGRVWSFLDITQRKRLEEALLSSEAHLHTLVQTIPDLVWLKDAFGVYLSCNKMFELLIGTDEANIVGKTDYDFFEYEQAEFFRENDRKAIAAGKPTRNEEWLDFALDGRRILFDVLKTPMFDSQGTFIGVLGIGHDITKRKQAEDELRKSEEKYHYMFDNNPQPMWIYDLETLAFLEINQAAADRYGYSKEEFLSMSIKDIRPPEDIPALLADIKNRDNPVKQVKEWRHLKKNGEMVFVEISAHFVTYNGRKARYVLVHDITDRKKTEAEIKLKNKQLLNLIAQKDKFFSIIAHDLRSPFNSFLGLTKILTEELPSLAMDEVQEIAQTMRNSATHLFRLLENLLYWARIEQGLVPFHPETIQLRMVTNECISMVKEPATIKGIEITSDIPEDIEVLADTNMLQTVIRNLVSNAVKFTRTGGKVSINARTDEDNNVEISIRDKGIGMNSSIVECLFQLGAKTNRPGTEGEPSTGLGLIICKEFVEKNGGSIWAESEEGKGSVFYFTIPKAKKS